MQNVYYLIRPKTYFTHSSFSAGTGEYKRLCIFTSSIEIIPITVQVFVQVLVVPCLLKPVLPELLPATKVIIKNFKINLIINIVPQYPCFNIK